MSDVSMLPPVTSPDSLSCVASSPSASSTKERFNKSRSKSNNISSSIFPLNSLDLTATRTRKYPSAETLISNLGSRPPSAVGLDFPGASPISKHIAKMSKNLTPGASNIDHKKLQRYYSDSGTSLKKYQNEEWQKSMAYISKSSRRKTEASNRINTAVKTLQRDTQRQLYKCQTKVVSSFSNRIEEVVKWEKKLALLRNLILVEITQMESCINHLVSYRNERFDWTINSNAKCLALREKRLGIDLVVDDPEIELLHEEKFLENAGDNLISLNKSANEVLIALRDSLHNVESDIQRKDEALNIDRKCVKMLNNDNDLQFDISVATSNPKNYIEPHVWTTSAKHLHERVQHLFVKSKALRSEIKKEKVNVDERMMRQEGRVNKRLRDRLLQYKSALAENRKLLRITNAEISRTKREMKTLSSEIDGKELPLKRATTALLKRSARIGAEQTRDKVHLSLIEEVKDMEAAISALSSALQGNNHTLADLFNAKAMLEEDITIKSNSIRIEEKCIKLRSYFSKLR